MTDDTERRIAALLADAPREPDAGFVAEVDALVRLDQAYALTRRQAWRRFGTEMAGAGAISAAALMLALSAGQGWLLVLVVGLGPLAWAATNRWAVR